MRCGKSNSCSSSGIPPECDGSNTVKRSFAFIVCVIVECLLRKFLDRAAT
jgi:hypothetical protein